MIVGRYDHHTAIACGRVCQALRDSPDLAAMVQYRSLRSSGGARGIEYLAGSLRVRPHGAKWLRPLWVRSGCAGNRVQRRRLQTLGYQIGMILVGKYQADVRVLHDKFDGIGRQPIVDGDRRQSCPHRREVYDQVGGAVHPQDANARAGSEPPIGQLIRRLVDCLIEFLQRPVPRSLPMLDVGEPVAGCSRTDDISEVMDLFAHHKNDLPSTPSGDQNDLANDFAVLEPSLGLGGFDQRKRAVDHRREAALGNPVEQGLEIVPCPAVRPDHLVLVGPPVARIQVQFVAGCRAAAEYTTLTAYGLLSVRKCIAAREVHGDRHAAAACYTWLPVDSLHGLTERFLGVVDEMVDAEFGQAVDLLVAARAGYDLGTDGFGDLYAGDTYAAAGSQHQYAIIGRDAALRDEHSERRTVGEWQCGGRCERDTFGYSQQLVGLHRYVLGTAAVHCLSVHSRLAGREIDGIHEHTVSYLTARNALADCPDLAGDVGTSHDRQGNGDAGHAPAREYIVRIDGACCYPDQHLVFL